MDPLRNPFAPGAGTPPPELSGRDALMLRAATALGRIQQGRSEKSLVLVGLRGVGKTVLLNEIRRHAEDLSYRTCLIEAHEGKTLPALLVPHLRRILLGLDRMEALNEQVKRGLRVLKSFMNGIKTKFGEVEISLDIDAEIGAADSGDLEADLPELMLALGRAGQSRGIAIGLFVDEVQYFQTAELSALIMAMHRIAQENMPVILFAAGLPQIIALFGNSKSYAERLFDFPEIGPLGPADASAALSKPAAVEQVRFSEQALGYIFSQSRGYPFFLQEWGYHTWNIAKSADISIEDTYAASSIAMTRLDEGFFRVRFDRLTPREKNYLRAMAELGPGAQRSGEIAKILHKKSSDLGPLRDGLIGKGMIYAPAHGDIAFTVPMFDEFMRRIMPQASF
ncbi:MAG: ATP-binding protein [Acidocella sp.]|nr:ATP-binding protein [Acidocella sp.]MDE8348992.1 ATP-binding protein [Acidocella sp.]